MICSIRSALQAANALGIKPICINPYMNTVAQVVEIAHCIEEGIQLIDELLQREVAWEEPVPTGAAVGRRGWLVRSAARHFVP
jgi:hypothetical protein